MAKEFDRIPNSHPPRVPPKAKKNDWVSLVAVDPSARKLRGSNRKSTKPPTKKLKARTDPAPIGKYLRWTKCFGMGRAPEGLEKVLSKQITGPVQTV